MIRSGFLKLNGGSWINLKLVGEFFVERDENGWRIFAHDAHDKELSCFVEGNYDTREEAEKALDHIFISGENG